MTTVVKDFAETIRDIAAQRRLLGEADLLVLDSLTVIDLVLALEEATGIEIPNEALIADNFRTIDQVAALLHRLRDAAAVPG